MQMNRGKSIPLIHWSWRSRKDSYIKTVMITPPKTNMYTQNDGLEKVASFKCGHFWYQFVKFLRGKNFPRQTGWMLQCPKLIHIHPLSYLLMLQKYVLTSRPCIVHLRKLTAGIWKSHCWKGKTSSKLPCLGSRVYIYLHLVEMYGFPCR